MWPTHYIPSQERIEGVPPPRFYLTTPPYPLELVETIASDAEPRTIGFVPFATDEAYIISAGAPVSGVMTKLLTSFDGGFEEIQSAGLPVNGVLRDILIRMNVPPENIISTGAPVSGMLKDPLVVYDNWPLGFDSEDLQSAGLPVSGALT